MNHTSFAQDPYIQALVTMHQGMPRGGPGSDASTLKALGSLPGLPERPRVIDLGCGPGQQSLALARQLGVKVTAVDFFDEFLAKLRADAQEQGLAHLIETVQADMSLLEYPEDSWDLVWSEGAIYLAGFDRGLAMCRPWLGAGGLMAVTESTWLRPDPPPEVLRFWADNYPAMRDLETNLRAIRQAGYQVLDHFVLPDSDWLEEYWGPMLPRLDQLAEEAPPDSTMARAVADRWHEIDLFRRHSDYYGYVFYLLRAEG